MKRTRTRTAAKKSKSIDCQWRKEPAEHNYPAAESYLSLLHRPGKAARLVTELRKARITQFKARIFCAPRG